MATQDDTSTTENSIRNLRKQNPLKLRPQIGPKRYCVVIDQHGTDGKIVQRPLNRFGQPAAFPDHAGSRWRAKKQLQRLAKELASARIWVCRAL